MNVNLKIRNILNTTGASIQDLYKKQDELFAEGERLSYNSLTRIINGQHHPRFSTLAKISQLLELPIIELIEDTEFEKTFFLRRNKRFDSFMYNEKAHADIISSPNCQFLSMELHLEPGGTTPPERSPRQKKFKHEKCVYVISGRLRIHVEDDVYNLTQRDSLTIESAQEHSFENTFTQRCIALITLAPKHF
jgi:quercetin dioxygenase-like cupin family protein